MPTILIENPYRLFLVSLDFDELPHIHIQREEEVAKFWLDPVVLDKASGFRPQELSRIGKMVEGNHDFLVERWHEFFGT